MDVLEQTSCVFTKNKLSLLVRIDQFPAFVTSKACCFAEGININNSRWYISIDLRKYCKTSGEHISITPDLSDEPETLGAFIHGERHHVKKDCSFDVEVQFKFKQIPTAKGSKFTHKFRLNSSNKYAHGYGTQRLAKIEVAFIFAFFLLNLKCV